MTLQRSVSDPAFCISHFYQDSAIHDRLLVRLRPYICPFAPMIEWIPSGVSILDVGCGGGMWLLTLAQSGLIKSGIGCDINPRALGQAKHAAYRYAQSGGGAKLDFMCTPSLDDWPYGCQFDVVSLIDVLHHVPKKMQIDFVRQALKFVRPGGRIVYKDMACTPSWAKWGNRLHDLVIARQLINYFPINNVISLADQAGFSILHESNWRRLFYGHEFLVAQA